jgi:hypothetical protein
MLGVGRDRCGKAEGPDQGDDDRRSDEEIKETAVELE